MPSNLYSFHLTLDYSILIKFLNDYLKIILLLNLYCFLNVKKLGITIIGDEANH